MHSLLLRLSKYRKRDHDNTVLSRTEINYTVSPAVTTIVEFTYDKRSRLIRETRTIDDEPDVVVYDLSYTYDQVGNRLTKADAVIGHYTHYFYDVDDYRSLKSDPRGSVTLDGYDFTTADNRLLYYIEYDDEDEELRTVRYTYYKTGNVSNITIKDESQGGDFDWYRDMALYYTTSGSLWRSIPGRWKLDENGDFIAVVPYNTDDMSVHEFYYDGGGVRFLARELFGQIFRPASLKSGYSGDGSDHYTDTLGLMPWGDFRGHAEPTQEAPPFTFTYSTAETARYLSPGGWTIAGLMWMLTLCGSRGRVRRPIRRA